MNKAQKIAIAYGAVFFGLSFLFVRFDYLEPHGGNLYKRIGPLWWWANEDNLIYLKPLIIEWIVIIVITVALLFFLRTKKRPETKQENKG
ncbi:MAG: hypothetical protein WC712_10795 [Candidatus Brocadiia bacterium]